METLRSYIAGGTYPFHTPGHKGGRFAPPELVDLWGQGVFDYDLPAMTATDNLLHPTHCVQEAQELAAELFGAAATFYTGGGATTVIAAMILAAVPPGGTILLPRNVHRSVASALVLSGARPKFLRHDVLPQSGALSVTGETVAAALAEGPVSAVLLTRPSYYGLARELDDVVAVCRQYNVPLLIDEAHGPHLNFLPAGSAPTSAMRSGASLAAQSCHKTLGSLVGTAQLHVGHDSPVSAEQVRDAFNLLQTTSPNYLQLVSMDVTRRFMAQAGAALFAQAVADAEQLAAEINALPGLRVLDPADDPRLAGHRRDPLRLAVNVAGAGWTGYDAELLLRQEYQIEDELSDWYNIVLVLGPSDDVAAKERLLAGLREVSAKPRAAQASAIAEATHLLQPAVPPLAMTPREAALGPKLAVPLAESIGRVCAESIMFYPPGIPLLMPGEEVTAEIVAVCRSLLAGGAHCYASDPTLATIRVRRP
ncbi:aminotransferase class I/II-fold pyridoxal phosphate-dependent enzyme [Lacipirellula limnantheis]|uniref:Arginine decarboxylase n=1 Tax=Lacipirellula limnantheis TaxID=2528024 RepID=A0A517U595_9BACT|nr:aminotransferase class I/II-fold pyridoxal phosphate-dependent enzyme [Lacipirellula limnantheis]QDT75777.1 Arginine decarboxylase [Lacipirellula limnantheis]